MFKLKWLIIINIIQNLVQVSVQQKQFFASVIAISSYEKRGFKEFIFYFSEQIEDGNLKKKYNFSLQTSLNKNDTIKYLKYKLTRISSQYQYYRLSFNLQNTNNTDIPKFLIIKLKQDSENSEKNQIKNVISALDTLSFSSYALEINTYLLQYIMTFFHWIFFPVVIVKLYNKNCQYYVYIYLQFLYTFGALQRLEKNHYNGYNRLWMNELAIFNMRRSFYDNKYEKWYNPYQGWTSLFYQPKINSYLPLFDSQQSVSEYDIRVMLKQYNFCSSMIFPVIQALFFIGIKQITKLLYRKSKNRLVEQIIFKYFRFFWDDNFIICYANFFIFECIINTMQHMLYLRQQIQLNLLSKISEAQVFELFLMILTNVLFYIMIIIQIKNKIKSYKLVNQQLKEQDKKSVNILKHFNFQYDLIMKYVLMIAQLIMTGQYILQSIVTIFFIYNDIALVQPNKFDQSKHQRLLYRNNLCFLLIIIISLDANQVFMMLRAQSIYMIVNQILNFSIFVIMFINVTIIIKQCMNNKDISTQQQLSYVNQEFKDLYNATNYSINQQNNLRLQSDKNDGKSFGNMNSQSNQENNNQSSNFSSINIQFVDQLSNDYDQDFKGIDEDRLCKTQDLFRDELLYESSNNSQYSDEQESLQYKKNQ